jgi:hypothetical protein
MSVCGNRLWSMTNHRHGLREKLFGGIHISLLALPHKNLPKSASEFLPSPLLSLKLQPGLKRVYRPLAFQKTRR